MIHNLNAKIRELEEEIKSSKTSHSRSGSSSRHKSGSMSSRTKSLSRDASRKESNKPVVVSSPARVNKSEKKYSSQSDDSRGKSLDHDDDNQKVDKISSVASNLSNLNKADKISPPRSNDDDNQKDSPSLDMRKLEKIKSDINSGGKTPSPNQLSK